MLKENDMGDFWTRSVERGFDEEETDDDADSVSVCIDPLPVDSDFDEAHALPPSENREACSDAPPNNDAQSPSLAQVKSPSPRSPNVGLFFRGPEQYDLDFAALDPPVRSASEDVSVQSLVGHWIGMYMSSVAGETGGLTAFDVIVHNADGTFSGEGVDLVGRYVVKGELKDLRAVFTRTYPGNGSDNVWQHQCLLDKDQDEVQGMWGHPANDEDIQSYLGGNDNAVGETWLGTFFFKRRPVEYFLFRSDKDFAENRIVALWSWAIGSVLRMVRSKHLQWKVIREHRDRRRRYLALTPQRNSEANAVEWEELVRTITPETLRFWDSLRWFRDRRTIAHYVLCDGCGGQVIGSRFTCVQCSQGEINNTMELCIDCMSKSVYREEDKKKHSPGHNLLQIRDVLHRRHVLAASVVADAAVKYAAALVDDVKDGKVPPSDPNCVMCEKTVTRPVWFCIECKGRC